MLCCVVLCVQLIEFPVSGGAIHSYMCSINRLRGDMDYFDNHVVIPLEIVVLILMILYMISEVQQVLLSPSVHPVNYTQFLLWLNLMN